MLTLIYRIIFFILFGPKKKIELPPAKYWVLVKEGIDYQVVMDWKIMSTSVSLTRYPLDYQLIRPHCNVIIQSIRHIGPFEAKEQAEDYAALLEA